MFKKRPQSTKNQLNYRSEHSISQKVSFNTRKKYTFIFLYRLEREILDSRMLNNPKNLNGSFIVRHQ
jgi:hypothetical protein